MTVGRLAARFGLSRTTLLYYDRLGLLRPSRSSGGYRRYTPDDAARLSSTRSPEARAPAGRGRRTSRRWSRCSSRPG